MTMTRSTRSLRARRRPDPANRTTSSGTRLPLAHGSSSRASPSCPNTATSSAAGRGPRRPSPPSSSLRSPSERRGTHRSRRRTTDARSEARGPKCRSGRIRPACLASRGAASLATLKPTSRPPRTRRSTSSSSSRSPRPRQPRRRRPSRRASSAPRSPSSCPRWRPATGFRSSPTRAAKTASSARRPSLR